MKNIIALDIKRTNGKINRVISNALKDNDINLTPVQGRLLMYISEKKEVTATDILEELKSVNKSTLSEIVNGMEKNGLIKREESKIDSRKKIIVLTDYALSIVKVMKKEFDYVNNLIVDGISLEDMNTFKEVLDKMNSNLERSNYDKVI